MGQTRLAATPPEAPDVSTTQTPRQAGAVSLSFNFLMLLLTVAASGLAIQFEIGPEKGLAFVFVMAGWVVSLCLHEFGHAYVAWKGGDHEILGTGYLSLDPRLYVDPFTSLVLPILFTLLSGIGFPGGAVYVNRHYLRSKAWQSAVSLAGPAMNLFCLLGLMLLYLATSPESATLRAVLGISALFQSTAIVLNLLPIPGLDGYGVLRPWLPDSIREPCDHLAHYSGLLLTGLFLFSGAFSSGLFGAGMSMVGALGFSGRDVVAGYYLMRLW